jgi:hypothetical protein
MAGACAKDVIIGTACRMTTKSCFGNYRKARETNSGRKWRFAGEVLRHREGPRRNVNALTFNSQFGSVSSHGAFRLEKANKGEFASPLRDSDVLSKGTCLPHRL